MDHVLRYQDTPGIKMIVVLGEVRLSQRLKIKDFIFNIMFGFYPCSSLSPVINQIGGTEEYKICQGIREGRITKPVVCWCIGTCATMFASEVCWLC